jgi:hypothetical protein
MEVYLLSEIDCAEVYSINTKYPHGPQIIVCDYGLGHCVEVTVINDPMYLEWRNALDLIQSFESREIHIVEIN